MTAGNLPSTDAAIDEAIAILRARRELITNPGPGEHPWSHCFRAAVARVLRAERVRLEHETASIPDPAPLNRLQRRLQQAGSMAPTTTPEGKKR